MSVPNSPSLEVWLAMRQQDNIVCDLEALHLLPARSTPDISGWMGS